MFSLMSDNWIIIGIGGVTNGGKTTLSTFLNQSFPGSVVLNQDHFFRPDDSKEHVIVPELCHKNWDTLEAVNWDEMMECLTQIINTKPAFHNSLLIVEGHLIFNYPRLEKLFRKKYFFTLSKNECYGRRITRVYDPPDVPGYFEKVVWPMYLSNLEYIKMNCTDIMFLNGLDNISFLQEIVRCDINKYLSSFCVKNNKR